MKDTILLFWNNGKKEIKLSFTSKINMLYYLLQRNKRMGSLKKYGYFFIINIIQLGIEFYYSTSVEYNLPHLYKEETTIDYTTLPFHSTFQHAVFWSIVAQLICGAISDRITSKYGRRNSKWI